MYRKTDRYCDGEGSVKCGTLGAHLILYLKDFYILTLSYLKLVNGTVINIYKVGDIGISSILIGKLSLTNGNAHLDEQWLLVELIFTSMLCISVNILQPYSPRFQRVINQ